MTLRELSQLYYIKRELRQDAERLHTLRYRASSPSRPNLSGVHGGGGGNRVEKYAVLIVTLEEKMTKKRAQLLKEQLHLESFIAAIPDSLTRQIFTLRFIECRSWQSVAVRVGGNNTAESVKMRCYRYLREK